MSDAKKCDRCGKYFDFKGKFVPVVSYRGDDPKKAKNVFCWELCPDCEESFQMWANPPLPLEVDE